MELAGGVQEPGAKTYRCGSFEPVPDGMAKFPEGQGCLCRGMDERLYSDVVALSGLGKELIECCFGIRGGIRCRKVRECLDGIILQVWFLERE